MKIVAAIALLGLNFYIYNFLANDEVIPERSSFREFPLEIGPWRCPGFEEMDPKALRFLGATDYVICTYFHEQKREAVNLYVGYHASQVRQREGDGNVNAIHPPEHCLPGSGWDIIDASTTPIAFPGLPRDHGLRDEGPTAKRFVIAKGDARNLVYFWYQGQGRVLTANEDVILYRFWDRATAGRTDGSLVRITMNVNRGDFDRAEATFQDFASRVTPMLPAYLPE